jgi:hypothetical protein
MMVLSSLMVNGTNKLLINNMALSISGYESGRVGVRGE